MPAGSTPTGPTPQLVFASPRALPRVGSLVGRVVVLDVAFAANASAKVTFETITAPFIRALGDRLAAWIDHHDHERHADFADDPRFVLATKAQHGACPEMITPALVGRVGPIDTLCVHLDLDGLYAAAKWILGGREPYPGADDDARAVDTRIGAPGPTAARIDHALRARFRDHALKRAIVAWLVGGMRPGGHADAIDEAAREFAARLDGTRALAERYVTRGRVCFVDVPRSAPPYDKTELLLAGQRGDRVAVVRDSGMVTIAAGFDSGWDFVTLFELGGGMPTRVSVPGSRVDEVIEAINRAPAPVPPAGPTQDRRVEEHG
jgi:hypothetical protein